MAQPMCRQSKAWPIQLLMANYSQTAIILHAFDQQLRPNLTPLLPVADRH